MNKTEIKKFIQRNESWHHTFHSVWKWYENAIDESVWPLGFDTDIIDCLEVCKIAHNFENSHIITAKDIIDMNTSLQETDHRDFLPWLVSSQISDYVGTVKVTRKIKQYSDDWDDSSNNRNCARALKMCRTVENIYASEDDLFVNHFSYHEDTGHIQMSYKQSVDGESINFGEVTTERIKLPKDEIVNIEKNVLFEGNTCMWHHRDFASIANLYITVASELVKILEAEDSSTKRRAVAEKLKTYKALNSMYGITESAKKYKVETEDLHIPETV